MAARAQEARAIASTYDRLREVLLRYMSAPVVDSMLTVAVRKAGQSPQTLRPEHVEAVLQQLSHGIRLFCPAERVTRMMLELAALAE